MDVLGWLFNAQLHIGDQTILWREVIGNAFGLASALGGMRRRVWAWPVGIIGNVLLFTVFLGAVFGTPNPVNLLGQAGRQVMFIIVSVYGWYRWTHRGDETDRRIQPRWANWKERLLLVVALFGGTALLTPLFTALGSYEPVWSDAWIFVGSLLATYGMARGWVEFWLIWVAVDIVGVPLLFSAGYYASGIMYAIYGIFTLTGFFVWMRQRVQPPAIVTVEGMTRPSVLSVRSTGSVLSIGSKDSVLSIGSVGSALSIGSVGSAGSIGSVGSFASVLSIGSAVSAVAVLSWASAVAILSAGRVLAVLGSGKR